MAHSHATESKGRDFQIAVSKFTFLHFLYSCLYLAGSSLEEKFNLPVNAEKNVLCLAVIIDALAHRMVE
jgi:Na+/citrate or Na+/malate symporter